MLCYVGRKRTIEPIEIIDSDDELEYMHTSATNTSTSSSSSTQPTSSSTTVAMEVKEYWCLLVLLYEKLLHKRTLALYIHHDYNTQYYTPLCRMLYTLPHYYT